MWREIITVALGKTDVDNTLLQGLMQGWFNSDYYYNTTILPHYEAIGSLVSLILNSYAKGNIGKDYKTKLIEYWSN